MKLHIARVVAAFWLLALSLTSLTLAQTAAQTPATSDVTTTGGTVNAIPEYRASAPIIESLRSGIAHVRSEASRTSIPIFGCDGSMAGWMPNSSSDSVVVGPIDATMHFANPARAAGSMPISSAIRNRCSICTAVVNIATSNAPAASRRTASRSGAVSSGNPY